MCSSRLSRGALERKLQPTNSLSGLQLASSGEYFVLQRTVRNLPHHMADKLLAELVKKTGGDKGGNNSQDSGGDSEKKQLLAAENAQV